MIEETLPSGSKLEITVAPFTQGKRLFQSFLDVLKKAKLSEETEVDMKLFIDIFCGSFTSPEFEKNLEVCMQRARIDGDKIDDSYFEEVEKRGDYIPVCLAIAKANIDPFVKSLYAGLSDLVASLEVTQANNPE